MRKRLFMRLAVTLCVEATKKWKPPKKTVAVTMGLASAALAAFTAATFASVTGLQSDSPLTPLSLLPSPTLSPSPVAFSPSPSPNVTPSALSPSPPPSPSFAASRKLVIIQEFDVHDRLLPIRVDAPPEFEHVFLATRHSMSQAVKFHEKCLQDVDSRQIRNCPLDPRKLTPGIAKYEVIALAVTEDGAAYLGSLASSAPGTVIGGILDLILDQIMALLREKDYLIAPSLPVAFTIG